MAKQEKIPGTERTQHADIESAADHYAEVRDERMEWTERETKAQATHLGAMKKHGLTSYKMDDGREVFIEPSEEKVKVRKPAPPRAPKAEAA